MLFSFSSSSIHLFPTCPWLSSCAVADLTNLLYPLPHHCPHMFLSSILIIHSIVVSDVIGNDHPHLFLFLLNWSSPHFFLPLRTHNAPVALILSVPLAVIITPFIAPPLTPVELVFPPPLPSVLQSTCDTLRSHSDSLGFTPNMLPRHPTLGNFEEFACWRRNAGFAGGVAHAGTWQQTVK